MIVCEFVAGRPFENEKLVIGVARHSRDRGLKQARM